MVNCYCTFLSVLWIFLDFFAACTYGKICPGFCVPKELCARDGGTVLGYCVNQLACCEASQSQTRRFSNETFWNLNSKYSSTCGHKVSWDSRPGGNKPIRFLSPRYPAYSRGSLVCQFELNLDKSTVGIRLDMDVFELDKKIHVHGVSGVGGSFGGGGDSFGGRGHGQGHGHGHGHGVGGAFGKDENFKCDADMFFIKGFSDWMTDPRCGDLSGFSLLMDIDKEEDHPEKKIILLFIMSSKKYRWKIKIHQITAKKLRKSELCLKTRLTGWEKSRDFLKIIPISKFENENPRSHLNLSLSVRGSKSSLELNSSANATASASAESESESESASNSSPLEFEFPWKWHTHVVSASFSKLKKTSTSNRNAKELADDADAHADHLICHCHTCGRGGSRGKIQKLAPSGLEFKKMCSGTIIDDRHILTVASCFFQNPDLDLSTSDNHMEDVKNIKIMTGGFCASQKSNGPNEVNTHLDLDTNSNGLHDIQSITVHFNYVSGFLSNDVAIIRTKTVIQFDRETQPIPLDFGFYPNRNRYRSPDAGATGTSTGTGAGAGINTDSNLAPDSNSDNGPFVFSEGSWVKPETRRECSATQALNLHLTHPSLKGLQDSNKYKGMTSNWICFRMQSERNTKSNSNSNSQFSDPKKSQNKFEKPAVGKGTGPGLGLGSGSIPGPSPGSPPGSDFIENYLNELDDYRWLAGSGLIGGDAGGGNVNSGSNSNRSSSAVAIRLEGIFSHVYYKQLDVMSNYSVDFQFQPPWPWYFSFTRFTNLSYIGSSRTKATSLAYFTSIEYFRKWILMAIS